MLVLSHADGLGVDLHQLRQRVLEAPGNGYGRPETHVVLGELLRRQGAGGVHAGPGLADDHVADMGASLIHLPDQLHRHLLRLPAGCAVADGDVLHAVLSDQLCQGGDSLVLLPLAVGGVYHGGVQHFARAVHHRHLAAHPVPRVQAHGDPALHRGLHQQGLQIQGELADGPLVRPLRQVGASLPLQGGEDQAVVCVLRRGLDKFHCGAAGDDHMPPDGLEGPVPVQLHADLQKALLLPPVDGQDLVTLKPGEGLGEVVVQPVDRVLLHRRLGAELSLPLQEGAEGLAEGGVVADGLGDDVGGAGEGVLHRLHALFGIHIPGGLRRRVRAVRPLGKQQFRQRRQALFPGNGGPGAALLLVGAVQVLHLRQRPGGVDGGGEFLRQLALFLDRPLHRLPAFRQVPQVLEALLQIPQGGVVHGAVKLLAVAGDEGNGVALVQKADHVFHMAGVFVQLRCQLLNEILHAPVPFLINRCL